jgi:hypothetical protein
LEVEWISGGKKKSGNCVSKDLVCGPFANHQIIPTFKISASLYGIIFRLQYEILLDEVLTIFF